MQRNFFVEVDYFQRQHYQERICGDVFVSGLVKEENRIVLVMSDGMGHGVKANVLATLTSTMARNFTREHKEPSKTAEIIMRTLPECSERKMNYSTFTILDIEQDGNTTILEYDNPSAIVIRNNKQLSLEWKNITLTGETNAGKEIRHVSFKPKKGDRIIIVSDGVTQSGLGTQSHPFGWGRDKLVEYLLRITSQRPEISARQLSSKVVNMALKHDGYMMRDDTTCATVYYREPRRLLVLTGPPYEKYRDKILANEFKEFNGKKIIMGATTADIIARETSKKIETELKFEDPELPPLANMEGCDLVTEGILTLNKLEQLLINYQTGQQLNRGPAHRILNLIRESDQIKFIIGTRINIAHQDPNLPVELEIRRTVVKRIARLLEEKLLKTVYISYI